MVTRSAVGRWRATDTLTIWAIRLPMASERHQPPGAAIPEKEADDHGDTDQVLDQAAGDVGRGHPVRERTPRHMLHEALDGNIEPRPRDAG